MNEATSHSPFEVMYGFKPFTLAHHLLLLIRATAEAANKLTTIADIKGYVYELIKLSKERLAVGSTRTSCTYFPTKR